MINGNSNISENSYNDDVVVVAAADNDDDDIIIYNYSCKMISNLNYS